MLSTPIPISNDNAALISDWQDVSGSGTSDHASVFDAIFASACTLRTASCDNSAMDW